MLNHPPRIYNQVHRESTKRIEKAQSEKIMCGVSPINLQMCTADLVLHGTLIRRCSLTF